MQLGLVYGQKSNKTSKSPPPYGLIGYSDSNFAGDPEDQKSVMESCFSLNGSFVSWSSKKQRTVSTSTTEAACFALGHAAREAVLIRRFINEMMIDIVPAITLNGDSETSIALTKSAERQHRTKNIEGQQRKYAS